MPQVTCRIFFFLNFFIEKIFICGIIFLLLYPNQELRIMKIVNPTVSRIDSANENPLESIESAARICYASESKGNPSGFVNRLIKQDHGRPLEFGTVRLAIPDTDKFEKEIKLLKTNRYTKCEFDCGICYITTNYRVIIENDLKYLVDWNALFGKKTGMFHERPAYRWTISRGIADEFRTHTMLSTLMQSTRYCNYSKDKFDKQVTFVRPTWFDHKKWCRRVMKLAWWMIEKFYLLLIRMGCTAQEARDVLPLGVKTEMVQCGFEEDWENFWYRRCATDAHPDARYIANKAKAYHK